MSDPKWPTQPSNGNPFPPPPAQHGPPPNAPYGQAPGAFGPTYGAPLYQAPRKSNTPVILAAVGVVTVGGAMTAWRIKRAADAVNVFQSVAAQQSADRARMQSGDDNSRVDEVASPHTTLPTPAPAEAADLIARTRAMEARLDAVEGAANRVPPSNDLAGSPASGESGPRRAAPLTMIRGRASLGPVTGTASSLTVSEVTSRLRSRLTAMRVCYERQLRVNPTLAGTVSFSFRVCDANSAGRVSSASASGMPVVETCVASMVRGIAFNSPGPQCAQFSGSVSYSLAQ